MPAIIPTHYLDRMCETRDYQDLVWISGVLCGSRYFQSHAPTYGFPDAAFSIVERVAWFAQGIRSGAWTYYEAALPECQTAMLAVLERDTSHPDFAEKYAFGMREWRVPTAMRALDHWLDASDDRNTSIAWQIVAANRGLIQRLASTDR
ncbi:hypothetical protein VQ02_04640 [Methylobacterium variabile]|jgi:hypothetical protein|uniref:Uncharacterized protein n=1 Tax=Methylobacterium variabile TaxID=298794 RepID=A0A0J6T8A9_9HYPH|nr:hypothetical protein [Methylobacterium variabile]KMO41808.1 hypothetical protein VQ02_04640 [Methylobacterium variabile]